MTEAWQEDLRLIESGFPCHQVGAETQRERGASSALPPLYFLHVWWARRPLTPSRAAVLASLLPADTDPDWFLRQLGIEKKIVRIHGQAWTLPKKALEKIKLNEKGLEILYADETVIREIEKENQTREELKKFLLDCKSNQELNSFNEIIEKWLLEVEPLTLQNIDDFFQIETIAADPAWANEKQTLGKRAGYRFPGDPYGYDRAFQNASNHLSNNAGLTVLDPTSGGGSIPFEALRLGYNVIANELNPVACVILHATLKYPMEFGIELCAEIKHWGNKMLETADNRLSVYFPDNQKLNFQERDSLGQYLKKCPEFIERFNNENIVDYLYCRQVTCPNCGGQAPLLNTCWLSKVAGDQWGVRIVPDGRPRNGAVRFETYRAVKGKGPKGENPDTSTVTRGTGTCVHCRQAIDAEEIKRQARGESAFGKWQDRLYCVVAVRFQPKLDAKGNPVRYKSGDRAGEIKTEKVRFFRPPNARDLAALDLAEKRLQENWDRWDREGLIPTENFPQGNDMRPVIYGMPRWCDMFTSRQLLGHVTLVEELNRLKPQILLDLGEEKGRAVVTYLQFALDKCLDYNSRQTLWHASRGVVAHTFTRHDFSLKWTFGELILTGPNSGVAWGINQITDAYRSIAELVSKTQNQLGAALLRYLKIGNIAIG